MRIVLVNWASIGDGASNGGGVNGYCRHLALGLAARGHRVAWVSSGVTYTASGVTGGLQDCCVRRREDHGGVQVFEIINSPVIAPGVFQFPEPRTEVSAAAVEAEFGRLMRLLRPEVVHFHNLEGLSAGCLAAARVARETRVVYSLHNYHTVCPQVYLMRRGRAPCTDFEGGRACVGCVEGWETRGPMREMRRRAGLVEEPPEVQGLWPRIAPGLLRTLHLPLLVRAEERPMPWREVRGAGDVEPDPVVEGATPGEAASVVVEPEHTAALDNDPGVERACGRVENDYGRRRVEMVGALSGCDRVLAVSEFVRRKFEALGVRGGVLETLTIGSRMTELARGAARDGPRPAEGRPIRLAFMGYNNRYKGLPMLLDTLDGLPEAVLGRYHLYIWAKDIERDSERLNGFSSRLGGLSVCGGYRYEDVPEMLRGKDVGIVPSIWWDNGPQTVMEFMACGLPVIGARAGGIPELVRDGVDGVLFEANDRGALGGVLRDLAARPERIGELAANVRPPKSMDEHVGEMEAVYRGCVGDAAGGGR